MIHVEKDDRGARSSEYLPSHWRRLLLADAYRILHDRDEAEDVVQDALVGAVTRDPALRHTALRYLRTAVHHRTIDVVRQRHVHARLLEHKRESFPDTSEWDPAEIDQSDVYEAVIRSVRDLAEPDRAIAKLHFWEAMTCRQIARMLGLHEKSVERMVARVRRKIRDACGSPG